jgi:hypothetical protein
MSLVVHPPSPPKPNVHPRAVQKPMGEGKKRKKKQVVQRIDLLPVAPSPSFLNVSPDENNGAINMFDSMLGRYKISNFAMFSLD